MTSIHEEYVRRAGVNNSEAMKALVWNAEGWSLPVSNEETEGSIGMWAAPVPVLPVSATCGETQRLLLERPLASCCVICDERRRPVGLVMSESFYIQMNAEYDPEHLYELPIGRLMDLYPLTVDFSVSVETVRERANARPSRTRKDAVIVMRGGEFFGVVHAEDLENPQNRKSK